ncbi:MAG: hypothetical protein ACJ75G_03635 [Gaiellaceae bacterium]
MSLKRKLVAGGAALLVAGGGAGAGLAASGHGGGVQRGVHAPPLRLTHAGFVSASAYYLGVDATSLRHEMKSGRTIAAVADATAGTSAEELTSYLVRAATVRLTQVAHRPLSPPERRTLHSWLTRRVTGFLNDTCPLSVSGLAKHLGGCHGMRM